MLLTCCNIVPASGRRSELQGVLGREGKRLCIHIGSKALTTFGLDKAAACFSKLLPLCIKLRTAKELMRTSHWGCRPEFTLFSTASKGEIWRMHTSITVGGDSRYYLAALSDTRRALRQCEHVLQITCGCSAEVSVIAGNTHLPAG